MSILTQQLLNAIRRTSTVNFDPFPAYAEKYLPFAMSAGLEITPGGRLWTCWIGGEDGPGAYLLASYSDDDGWILNNNPRPVTPETIRELMVDRYEGSPVGAISWCIGDNNIFDTGQDHSPGEQGGSG